MPKFLSAIDLLKNELQNPRMQNLGSAPSSPVAGQFYFDTAASLNRAKYWDGAAWMMMGGRLDQIAAPTAAVAMNSQQITGLADPSGAQHAATQNFVVTRKVTDLAAPTSAFSMNSQQITNLLDPSSAQHAATQNYVLGRKVTDLTAPTASFSMNSQKIVSLGTPTVSTDAATMGYVDTQVEAARQGVSYKMPVRAAATTNVNLAAPGTSIGGVTSGWVNGHRFLATNQTTGSENGIYVWTASGTPATRATDADTFGEVQDGTQVYVAEGTDAEKVYRQTATITSFTGQTWGIAAAGGTYVAGGGLTDSANTFAVGAGTGITVNADDVAINTAVVVRKHAENIGNGSLTSFTVSHNLGTRDIHVTVRETATPWAEVIVDNAATTTNTATIGPFIAAPTTDQYRVFVTA